MTVESNTATSPSTSTGTCPFGLAASTSGCLGLYPFVWLKGTITRSNGRPFSSKAISDLRPKRLKGPVKSFIDSIPSLMPRRTYLAMIVLPSLPPRSGPASSAVGPGAGEHQANQQQSLHEAVLAVRGLRNSIVTAL